MAVELAAKLMPDVVIMDVLMPKQNGIDATRQIVSEHPQIKVIGYSVHPGSNIVSAMREAGAAACVSKSDSFEVLIAAIHACLPADQRHIS
jgi:DNA-binding NarL/FixJ family response regulator